MTDRCNSCMVVVMIILLLLLLFQSIKGIHVPTDSSCDNHHHDESVENRVPEVKRRGARVYYYN